MLSRKLRELISVCSGKVAAFAGALIPVTIWYPGSRRQGESEIAKPGA